MKKQIISMGLATSMLMGGMALAVGIENVELANSEAVLISEKVEVKSNFTNYRGKISEIIREEGTLAIIVDSVDKNSNHKTIKFNISEEALVLTDKAQGDFDREKIVEGMTVEMLYNSDAPMTMSLPPMTNAKVLVVRESEEKLALGVKVDTFNKIVEENNSLVSVDNDLRLNITEETVIVDKDGKKVEEKDLDAKDLLVFYGPAVTMSIPAQSNAVKIIVVGEQEKAEEVEKPEVAVREIKVFDKFIQQASENVWAERTLKNKMYKSSGVVMMPIREVAEDLGYKVSWNGKTKQVELTKGANFLTVKANEDNYGFAKMIVKLGKASENKNGTIFVPVNFIEEVMKLEVNVNKDGVMVIK